MLSSCPRRANPDVRIVFFDIGNCLYDPYRTFARALMHVAHANLADPILQRFGAYPDQPGRHDPMLAAFGLTPAEISAYFREFIEHPVYHAGSPEVLDRLRARGARLGVISDGHFDTQVAKLAAWGLADTFAPELTFIGCSASDRTREPGDYNDGVLLPATKREIATFHMISDRVRHLLGAEPDACCMVGDDFVRDAHHPVQAGWQGVWFVPNEPARRTLPDAAGAAKIPWIEDLLQLEDLVYPPPTSAAAAP